MININGINSNSNENKIIEQKRKVKIRNKTEWTGFFTEITKNEKSIENKQNEKKNIVFL